MQQKSSQSYRIDPEAGRIHLGRVSLPFPRHRIGRMVTGGLLVVGGCLGFLPVLGFWMIPLGLLVLSHDLASVRRFRRRASVKILRKWRAKAKT